MSGLIFEMRDGPVCCIRCDNEQQPNRLRRFIGCAVCGNKRCPKATDHRNTCTNSNAPGQHGSIYGHVAPIKEGEGDDPTASA